MHIETCSKKWYTKGGYYGCNKITIKCGPAKTSKERKRCSRMAQFLVNGHAMCSLHAGEHALNYMVNKNEI